jgi:hypothetical protein
MSAEAEVLIEMRRLGDSVRVTAVCPETGLEATIVGPAGAGEAALARAAASKLRWLREKRGPRPAAAQPKPASGRGVLA